MRVLHYVDENNLAWSAPWIQLLKAMGKLGVENIVACRSGGTLSGLLDDARILNFCYDPIAQWLPAFTFDLGKIVDRVRPDIIHTRLSSAARLGGYWGRKKGIPVISTFDKYPKAKYYKDSDVLIGCSSAVTEHVKKLDLPRARALFTVLNPVLVEYYARDEKVRSEHRAKLGLAPDDVAVIGMGRFVAWKGWDDYLSAVASITDVPNLKFILVGSGEEEKKMRELACNLGVEKRVAFFPFAADVRPWLWAADIFVQPSYEPEGFSLMLVEAMASGLPPVVTDIGGTPDIVENGKNGITFAPRDVDGLKNGILSLLDRGVRERMAHAALTSLDAVKVDVIAEQTLEVYKRTLRLGKFTD